MIAFALAAARIIIGVPLVIAGTAWFIREVNRIGQRRP